MKRDGISRQLSRDIFWLSLSLSPSRNNGIETEENFLSRADLLLQKKKGGEEEKKVRKKLCLCCMRCTSVSFYSLLTFSSFDSLLLSFIFVFLPCLSSDFFLPKLEPPTHHSKNSSFLPPSWAQILGLSSHGRHQVNVDSSIPTHLLLHDDYFVWHLSLGKYWTQTHTICITHLAFSSKSILFWFI